MWHYRKTLTALILAVLLAFTPSLAVPAADTDSLMGVNVIKNGGFEEVNEEAGITLGDGLAYADWQNDFVTLEKENVYEGNYAVRIKKPSGVVDKPWYKFPVRDFQPGALYEASMMVNHDLNASEGGRGQVLVEYYAGNTYLGGDGGGFFTGSSNNQWVEAKTTVQIPSNATYVLVYCYVQAVGEVIVDNVSFSLSGGPEPYAFNTDEIFYYEDIKEGLASVSIDAFYEKKDEPYTSTVDFAFLDGEKELASAKKVSFSDAGKAEWTFDIGLLKEMETMYNVKAWVRDKNGEVIREYQSEVYKVPFPTSLRREDFMFIDENGKEFVPSIAYHPIADYGKMKEIGINVAEIGAYSVEQVREALDKLHAQGLKAMVSLFCGGAWMKPAGHPLNQDLTRKVVEEFKDHPAVWAWCPCDEPFGRGPNPDQVRWMIDSYKIIRGIDKSKPIYVVDYTPAWYHESIKYCDVFAGDIYTQNDMSPVSIRIKAAAEATKRSGKPVYFIGKVYESSDAGLPNIRDVRGGNYAAFEQGARGIGYYSLAKAIGHVGNKEVVALDNTDLWEPLKKFAEVEQEILFDYYVHKKYQTFNVKNDEDVHSLYYTSWINGDDLYIVVHNRGNSNITAEVPLVSSNGLVKIDGGNAKIIAGPGENVKAENGKLVTEMGPQEVYLYKMPMKEKLDSEILDVEITPNEDAHDGTFSDLAGYGWAAEAIESMFSAGIANETTVYSYSPGKNITRGDFAMFLMRALGLVALGEGFSDVKEDAPYARELITGRALGILEGVGDNLFNPEGEISRQDMMKMAARAMRYAEKLSEISNPAVLEAFSDKTSIADYALADVAAMVEAGIILGNADGTINPLGHTTRAEAAVIMDRIIKAKKIEKEPEEEPTEEPEEKPVTFIKETVSEEQAVKRESALRALRMLKIADIADSEAAITRAEAARMLVKMLGMKGEMLPAVTGYSDVGTDHPDAGYIAAVTELGFMRGVGDGTFAPDAPVQFTQMVKILVDALGYKAHAEAQGGFSAGYMLLANRLELMKGISTEGDGAISGALAALLIRNALNAPVAQRVSFGTDSLEFMQNPGENALTLYHGLSKKDGVITAIHGATIDAPRLLREGEVCLDGMVYLAGDSGAENCLGQTTTIYWHENEADEAEIVLCEAKRQVEVITLLPEDIDTEKSSKNAVYWYDEAYRLQSEDIKTGAAFIYNGKAKADFDGNDFDIADGTVTLLKESGTVTTVICEAYENYVVKSVSPMTDTVSFMDGEPLTLDFTDASKYVSLINLSGKEIEIVKLQKGNVLSVAKSADGTVLHAVVSDKKVNGTVTETDGESVFINGEEYPLAENLVNPRAGYNMAVPELGKEAVFILDKNGKIAYMDKDSAVRNYAYLIYMHKNEGLDSEVWVRFLSAKGEMKTAKMHENIEFNGEKATPGELYDSLFLRNVNGTKQQIIRYALDAEGRLTKLETAKKPTGMAEAERLSAFTLDYGPAEDGAGRNRFVGYSQNSIAEYYRFDDFNTVCFRVPDKPMDDKYYSVYDLSRITDSETMPNISLYDIDENLVAGAVVSVTKSTDVSAEAGFGTNTNYFVVSDIRTVLNEDGEATEAIAAYGFEGETLLEISDGLEIAYSKMTNSKEKDETGKKLKSIKVSELRTGDVILCEKDLTGKVGAATMILRAGQAEKKEIGQADVSQYYTYSEAVHIYGDVIGVLDTGLHIKPASPQWKRLYVWKNQARDIPIYLCETKNGKSELTEITKADITLEDEAWAGALRVFNVFMVIYR